MRWQNQSLSIFRHWIIWKITIIEMTIDLKKIIVVCSSNSPRSEVQFAVI